MADTRVAFLDDHLSFGGATTFLCGLIPALRRHGIGATLVASDCRAEMAADLRAAGVPLRLYPFRSRGGLHDDTLLHAYRQVADLRPAAVVANHENVSFDLLRYAPSGVLRIGVIHADHAWYYKLVAFYGDVLDVVVCVSSAAGSAAAERLAGRKTRVAVIPYGIVPPEAPVPLPADPQAELRLLYVGRLVEEQKRVSRFAPIWQELRKTDFRITWTLVGTGPEEARLRAALPSDDRHRVVFAGKVEHARMPDYYRTHHVVLLTSDYEGLPLSILEGMAYGLIPVVTEQRSGIPDLVDETCGVRVPPDAPEAVAAAVARLRSDAERLGALRVAARDKIRAHYTRDCMAARWARLLLDNLAPSPPPWPRTVAILGPPARRGRAPGWYYAAWLRPLRRAASAGLLGLRAARRRPGFRP